MELLAGSLVRYEDARSALEKLGAVGQDTGLKTHDLGSKAHDVMVAVRSARRALVREVGQTKVKG